MNLQIGRSITTGNYRQFRKQYLAVACGGALTVAALSGIGAWQATSHGRIRSATTAPASVTSTSGARLASPSQRFTYYVVGSQEQAEMLELGLQAGITSIADSPAGAPSGYTVAVVSSPAEEALLRQAVTDADAFAAAYGVDGPEFEDLRAP